VTLQDAGDLLLLFGWALPALGAPIEYAFVRGDDGRRLGFRHSELGRHLMAYMVAVAAIAILGVLRLLTGESLAWQALRVAGFAAFCVVTWWRWAVVHQARMASVREREGDERGDNGGPLAPS
jgi:hypothetical protein